MPIELALHVFPSAFVLEATWERWIDFCENRWGEFNQTLSTHTLQSCLKLPSNNGQFTRQCSLENNKYHGLAHSSQLKEMSMNHNMRPFLLLFIHSFALLNAELYDKQLTKKQKIIYAREF
jgi:hypothetical protein